MAYWNVGAAAAVVADAAAVVAVPTSDVAMTVVVEVDGCADSAVLESFFAAAAKSFPEAALGATSSTGVESGAVGVWSAAAGGFSTPAVTVVGSGAAWPELSDEVGEAVGVDVFGSVESVELGWSGPVPETVVVVTVRSALGAPADAVVVDDAVSALSAV